MIAILDNIRSVQNVASIFRTADAVGITKLYLVGITPTPLDRFGHIDPSFGKISLGAEKSVGWEKKSLSTTLIKELKKAKYKIYAVEQSKKSKPYYQFKIKNSKSRIVLIFGNEVKGLAPRILSLVDNILEIPMRGKKESLNVAVTFGIVTFHLLYA